MAQKTDKTSPESILPQEARDIEKDFAISCRNFPEEWPMECRERFAHPDGYILSETPINPKYIFGDSSLLFRISMRTPEGKFFPATFVVDTLNVVSGRKNDMSKDFYLSLGSYGTYGFDHTPESRDPANIIGLMLIGDLGLTVLSADKWEFERKEPYW